MALAQAGDDRAFTVLVAMYEPLLRAQVAHFRLPWADAEDFSQEGLLGLLAAVRTFRPEKGVAFRTYASTCIRNRLFSALRRQAACGGEVAVEQPPDGVEPLREAALDPAAVVADRETAERYVQQLRERLSALEFAVFWRYIDGETRPAIAKATGLSLKAVDNALQRVRRKMQLAVRGEEA